MGADNKIGAVIYQYEFSDFVQENVLGGGKYTQI